MKLTSIIFSQVIHFARWERVEGPIYFPEILQKLQERYGFMEVPRQLSDINPVNGTTFSHGKFREISIDKFQIYGNGVIAESRAPIETIEEFVRDIEEWALGLTGAKKLNVPAEKYVFTSHIEVQFEFPMILEKLERIAALVSKIVSSYGGHDLKFETTGVAINYDGVLEPAPRPNPFRIDRRDGFGFETNLYFCQAPMRTRDHLNCLAQAERILAA